MSAPRATLRDGVSKGENRDSPLCVSGADSFRANIEIPKDQVSILQRNAASKFRHFEEIAVYSDANCYVLIL